MIKETPVEIYNKTFLLFLGKNTKNFNYVSNEYIR